ncbi:MAG: RraA family protein [Candidatus Dormibacteraceae bacterium]
MAIELGELCQRYRALYMPAVSDALYGLGLPEQVLPSGLRPLFPEQRMVGEAFTVQGRHLDPIGWDAGVERIQSYLQIFERLTPDTVLVSVNPNSHVGHFGELTGNSAKEHGCVGVVLEGNLRDTEGLREIGLQVFYRDLSPLNAIGRWEMTAAQEPVKIGSVTVHPGDIMMAEFDGILVIPRKDAERVLLESEKIADAERNVRTDMRKGVSPLRSFETHGHI